MVSTNVMCAYARFSGGRTFLTKVALVLVESILACADWWLALGSRPRRLELAAADGAGWHSAFAR